MWHMWRIIIAYCLRICVVHLLVLYVDVQTTGGRTGPPLHLRLVKHPLTGQILSIGR